MASFKPFKFIFNDSKILVDCFFGLNRLIGAVDSRTFFFFFSASTLLSTAFLLSANTLLSIPLLLSFPALFSPPSKFLFCLILRSLPTRLSRVARLSPPRLRSAIILKGASPLLGAVVESSDVG